VHLLPGITETTTVFPELLVRIFPEVLVGLSLALVFGAAMTTYTAGLQSSGSLFVFNIYKPLAEKYFKKSPDEQKLVKTGKYFELIISLSAMFIAPFILFAHDGFYTYLQTVSGLFNMPIFTVMILGILTTTVTPRMAQLGLVLYMICYFVAVFIFKSPIHYLHLFALLFFIVAFIMWFGSRLTAPNYSAAYKFEFKGQDYTHYWKNRYIVGTILLVLMIAIYILLSPLGLAH